MAFEYVNLKDIDKEVLEGYNLKPENQSYQGVDLQPGEMKTNEFKFDYSDNGNYFGVNKAELEEATAISKQVQTDFAHDNLIHTSNVYRKYFANNEENLRVAKSINAEIPVLTVEQITNSPEDLNSAVEKLNRKHKIEALLPEGEKDLALSRLYEEYPDIFKLNDVDAAIALHNIENVKVTKGIIESAMLGYDAWKANDERNKIGNKGYRFGNVTAEDKQRLKELREKSKEMALNMPDFIDNPLAAIAAGTMQNVPMIVSEFGEAQLVAIPAAMVTAGGTFAATKDPVKAVSMGKKAYNVATKVAMGVDMFNDIVGNYYLDYIEYQDGDGKQLLTNNEARLAATLAAAAETYLEIGNFDKVVDLLKNKPGGAEATEVLAGIVANTKDKASIKAQIAYFLQNRFGKAAGVFKEEIVEEFNQSLSSDTVHNIFAMYKPGGNLEVIPIAEMGSNAVESAVEAGPAVAGMTVGGKVISRTTIGKVLNKTELGSAIGVSSIVKQYASAVQEKISDAASIQNNVAGQIMIEKLTENKKDNKLAKESPDIYNQLLTNQVQGTRYENVVVDSELLTGNGRDKEGTEIYYQLAEASGKTREEAEQMLELGTPLQVPMAKYVEAVEDNNIREKLKNYISFDVNEGSFARIKEMAVDMKHKLDRIYAKDWKGQIETVQNFVDKEFQDEQERAVANQILVEYTNPAEGVKALRQEYQNKLDELINPVVETMREGMKQGVDLVAKDDNGNYDIDGEGHIGSYGMISNNAQWYRNYYAENKKAPSEKELRELARNVLLGDNPYGIITDSMLASGEEARQTDEYYENAFNSIDSVLATLDKIEPTMSNLDVSDLVAMEGLSKEGVEVFKAVKKYLKEADSKKSKEAAAASAAIVAHHAEVYADNRRKMGDTNYTALDWLAREQFKYGEDLNGDVLKQQQENPVYNYSFEENQEAIKKWADNLDYKDIPRKKGTGRYKEFKTFTKQELYEYALEHLRQLNEKKIVDVLGNELHFEPGKGLIDGKPETWESYALHFIAGKDRPLEMAQALRAEGLTLLEEVVKDPYAVVIQKDRYDKETGAYLGPGNKLYVGMFELDEKDIEKDRDENDSYYSVQIIIGVEEREDKRVVTSFVAKNRKRNKNNALDGVASHIKNAKEILYIKRLQTGHPLTPTNGVSQVDANLHSTGQFILPQLYNSVKENMQNANLLQQSTDITDSPFFREWFGESKTVDENGQPLVLYHGTATPNITEFKHSKATDKAGREMAMGQGKGKFYFATTEMAANAAAQGAMWRGQGKTPTVMPVYLKLENPVDLQTYKDRYQALSGHDLNEGYSESYTMKDRDKFIAKLDKQLQKEGVDGILDKGYGFAAVFKANQIKSTENQGTFDSANNNIYMQQGEEKDLVAYHNITGQELQRAIEFGGFPVPSIAIMKKDVAYDMYGEITLVGNKDMVDPKRGVPVYSKDGYTITFPKPSYAVPKIGVVRKFKEKWQQFFNSIDDGYSIDRITDEYRNPERMADNLRNSFGFQYYYLTEVLGKNIEIPVNEYVPRMPILKDETYFKKLYDLVESVDNYEDLEAWEKDIGAVVEEFYDDRIAKAKLQGIKKKLIELKAEIVVDGVVNNNELNRIFKELGEYKKAKENPGKDYRALKDKVRSEYNDIIYGNEYYKWVDEQIKELVGEGKVKIGNKLYPFTLENVTKYMVKNAGAATEESFTFSAGKVAAIASQKFKSIDEMHAAEHMLGTNEEFNKSADAAKEIGDRYRAEIAKYQKYASEGIFTAFDDAMEALAKASDSKGYTTIDKLRTALKKSGGFVDNIPNEVLQLGVDYLKALTDTTTQYFEAKPQRAIHISEFTGAVVPSNADPNLVKQLTDAGLVVETYEPGNNAGRQEATQRIQQQQDVLFQKQGNVQGYTKFTANGERIVNLLQSADQSTFMHEMAHIFYEDIKELAQDPRATEQMAKDWNTLYGWASWDVDQLKEYEGTASYKEFAKRNSEILEAQEKGYVIRNGREVTLEKLLEEWAQERFARGFEVYLETGKAPSKPLQSAFSKFKQWLIRVYKAVTGAGAKPSKEVKEVMDRMIATQDEIDNALAMANIQGLEKQGLFRYLSDTSQEMWERNLENIQEDVSKKVMKLAMRDLTDKAKEERAEALKKEREAAYERISQEPIFVAWKFLQENPNLSTSDVVEQFANMTVKEYTEQLRILGGSLDGAVDQYMEMYERNLPQVTTEEIKQAAKEAVTNSYYTKLAEAFELQALEQYARDEQRLSRKLAKIEAKDEAERKEAEKAIRQLDARQRQQEERDRNVRALRAETKNNERLQEQMKKLELQILDLRKQKADIKREARTNREARVKEVKEQKQKVIDQQIEKLQAKQKQIEEERKRFRLFETEERKGRYIYRNSLDRYIQNIVKYAEQKMAALPISDATNPVMWSRMAENYTNTSLELFSKGQYELAARQKRIAFFYRQMAELAEKNHKKVEKRTNTLVAHTRTMLKNKNVVANDRYLYNHLMYNFGLANKDAQVPPGYPDSYRDVLITYDANLELSYVDQDGNIDLPDWLTGAMGTEGGRYKEGEGYRGLRMDQLELLYNVMNNIYKAGSEAKKLRTTRDAHGNVMMVDEVVGEIVGNAMGNIPFQANEDVTGAGNETTWEAWKRRANEAHVALLKPETILRQLGDTAIKYIYNPIKLAADNEMMETEILAGKIRGMTEAYRDGIALMYKNQGHENYEHMADQAMADLRTKKNYKLGTSLLTKENVLVLAFNWGTFVNRKRVMDGYNVTQAQVENVLAELDSADWQLVINVWELFDDYWPRLQEVEANISGVVLEKQEAVPFTIVDKTGFTYNLGGGYYPIKYDRVKNIRIGDHAQDETARLSMSGMTRFGIGLGNTKERMETVPYKLRNDFGVIQEALTDTLHNICMRETVRDVNRIIRDPGFSQFMGEYYGNATVKMLENWVLDCWAKEPQQKDFMEKAAQWIRQKQTVAALGFRTTTALLNICNFPYVVDYLGFGRAISALKNFYAHPQAQFDLCMEKSIFLRDRAETMDRDMGEVLKRNKANPGDKIMNAVEEKAFWLISRTDLMLACPMWVSEYERVFQESMDKKMTPEQAEREAVLAGDAAVRRTFGSGQIQDLAAVQKSSEFTKTLTMYYSFFSVVHNALMMKVFEARQATFKKEELAKRLQPIAEGVLFWIIIPSAMEACIRAAASGDDKDKEAKNVAKKFLATTAGTMVGGIPLLRDTIPAYLEWAMGGRYYGVSGTPIGDTADQVQRIMSGIKSGKKTKLDVMRDVAAVTSSVSGLPKTMLDGMITAMQFIDHGRLTPEDIRHYLWAVMFDKNPDKK